MQKRVLIVENYPETDLGQIGVALDERAVETHMVRPWKGETLPDSPDGFHGIVVLGGEQSALDDHSHPYLPDLAKLMRDFGDSDQPVLGICLGSQILARAHGGENLLGIAPEFGWHGIDLTDAAGDDPVLSAVPSRFPIFEWHSDTFTLPPGALHLATSGAVINQCFRIGRASYGMQFHFEANRHVVEAWRQRHPETIDRIRPGWLDLYEAHVAAHADEADAAGLAIARAWAGLL